MKRGMMPAATPDNPMGQSQKYMMYIMPVFALSGLYWQFGLVLYWVTTNLWTLGQQWVLFRKYPQPAAAGAGGAAPVAGTALAPSTTRRAVTAPRKRPAATPTDATPEDATPEDATPADKTPSDARSSGASKAEDAPRDRAGSNGASRRNSNAGQPRNASRRTTGPSPARSATPSAAPATNGGGMLRRLGKKNAEPEPPPEPEIKIVRQQRQRQSRSKRSGKR
jgi:YidC/Oxa1 family membrane protein insertase